MTRKTSILLGLAGAGALLPLAALAQSTGNEFVPLTAIPVFSSLTNTSNIAGFLNALYRICIGAAASLAVIQIFRAGMEFMLNTGSFTHNEKAKNLISGAVFGLLLVLSPAIVFGIIDPRILNLTLDTSSLQLNSAAWNNTYNVNTVETANTLIDNIFTPCGVTLTDAQKQCVTTNVTSGQYTSVKNCIPTLNAAQQACVASRGNNLTEAGGAWESNDAGAADRCRTQGGTVTASTQGAGWVRCLQPSASTCPTFVPGTNSLDASQLSCCGAPSNPTCTVQAHARSQYSCVCSAP